MSETDLAREIAEVRERHIPQAMGRCSHIHDPQSDAWPCDAEMMALALSNALEEIDQLHAMADALAEAGNRLRYIDHPDDAYWAQHAWDLAIFAYEAAQDAPRGALTAPEGAEAPDVVSGPTRSQEDPI